MIRYLVQECPADDADRLPDLAKRALIRRDLAADHELAHRNYSRVSAVPSRLVVPTLVVDLLCSHYFVAFACTLVLQVLGF